MALQFIGDAISLSGLTGSKVKCEVISEYYPFWWKITSGGERARYSWSTAIVELNAATSEVYIKDTAETILGSSGHALSMKCAGPHTGNLKVILVEEDAGCYDHLKKVIRRRWPDVDIKLAEGLPRLNTSNIYLFNLELEKALDSIERIDLRNSLFFFDPLRSVEFQTIERVARRRIKTYYRTGTEFIIFLFTSDWFLGRDDFAGLPTVPDKGAWSEAEKVTVAEADALLGDTIWHDRILNKTATYERENDLVETYRERLHKWFRYVLPMPFNPKGNQLFHLILCSNYEVGVRATRDFYCERMHNPKYAPNNRIAFDRFRGCHPQIFEGLWGNRRPKQWLTLWKVITGHEEGICDYLCEDLKAIEQSDEGRQAILDWLAHEKYLTAFEAHNAWTHPARQYKLNWTTLCNRLGVDTPLPFNPLSLKPLSLEQIDKWK